MDVNSVSGSVYNSYDTTAGVNAKKMTPPQGRQEPPDIDTMVSQMSADLGLNDNQMIELKKILQKNQKSMDEEMSSSDASGKDHETMKAKMDGRMDQMTQDIKSILTDEQATKLESIMNSRGPRQKQTDSEYY